MFDFSRSLVQPFDLEVNDRYDLGFFCVGYERRARYAATKLAEHTSSLVSIEYPHAGSLAYDENLQFSRSSNARSIKAKGYRNDRSSYFSKTLVAEIMRGGQTRIWIDVSAMDRSLLARVLYSVLGAAVPPFRLRIVYAPARYAEPSFDFSPMRDCSPVIPELAGNLGLYGREITLLLGLGYEYGVALGLLQLIEPHMMIALTPLSPDPRYEKAVSKANFAYDFGAGTSHLIKYKLDQPVSTFDRLLQLTRHASKEHSFIVVPNGPKLFAAIAIIVGMIRSPNVCVMRASLNTGAPAIHVEPSGEIIGFDIDAR